MTQDSQHTKGHILYFEDDIQTAQMICEFLNEDGFMVHHFPSFPASSSINSESYGEHGPIAVLMDIKLPDINGYDACQKLLNGLLPPTTPVVFISGLADSLDIEKAYEAGADDYLTKPVKLKELSIKLHQYKNNAEKSREVQAQLEQTRTMAFEAMTTSSELGEILRFHEQLMTIDSFDELGKALLDAIAKFHVNSSVMIFPNGADTTPSHYYSEDGNHHPLEEKILEEFHGRNRIFSWRKRTFFNYPSFSVLIKNMPIDNESRYGILKDQFCLLLNGVEGRIQSILTDQSNRKQTARIKTVAQTIGKMVIEMEGANASVSERFEQIMLDMEDNLSTSLIQFNLLENEEQTLISHVKEAIQASTKIFEDSVDREKRYRKIMTNLMHNLTDN